MYLDNHRPYSPKFLHKTVYLTLTLALTIAMELKGHYTEMTYTKGEGEDSSSSFMIYKRA